MSTTVYSMVAMVDDPDARAARSLGRLDPGEIDSLVECHGHRLLRYLVHLTSDRSLAEDLFQETWLRVIERGGQYDPRRPFVAWLLGIARHLALDALRRKQPVSLEAIVDPPDEGRSTGPSPLESLAARERRDHLTAAAAALPAVNREVLFLRFQEDLALEEIARVTGSPLPTVKSRLYRGLEHLARRLGREP